MASDFYKKYFRAYDNFRSAVDNKTKLVVSLSMYRDAQILSDTPLSEKFINTVKGIESGRIWPEGTDEAKRIFLKEQAAVALQNCGIWHNPYKL